MSRTLKALSALLTYPTAELQQAAGEISEVIDGDTLIPPRIRAGLHELMTELATGDLYDLQERYVCCSTARAHCRCICSSTCMARAATAARP